MTDKEFKRLSRSQLIEIIYQFQIKVEELTQENQTLSAALEDKRLRIAKAGSIAEAVLEMNQVMQAAQNAAQQYLDEIQAVRAEMDCERENIRAKANEEAEAVIQKAKADASEILQQAQTEAASIISRAQAEEKAPAEQETPAEEAPAEEVPAEEARPALE